MFPFSSSASSFDDLLDPAWPITQYEVAAVYGHGGTALEVASPRVMASPFVISAANLSLDASGTLGPRGRAAAMDSTGNIHIADDGTSEFPTRDPALYCAAGTGFARLSLSDFASLLPPGIAVDGSDHPHAVYARRSAPNLLVHAWHDGTAWNEEEVARPNAWYRAWFGVASDGTVHVAWDEDYFDRVNGIKDASKAAGGSWSVVTIPAKYPRWTDEAFAVAADGTAFFMSSAAFEVLARAPGGDWVQLPIPDLPRGYVSSTWLVPANAERAAVIWEYSPGYGTYTDIYYSQQDASTWTPSEHVASRWITGGQTVLGAALTRDGSRVVVVIPQPGGLGANTGDFHLYTRTASGWTDLVLGPSMALSFSLGFTTMAKAWVWVPFTPASEDGACDALFVER